MNGLRGLIISAWIGRFVIFLQFSGLGKHGDGYGLLDRLYALGEFIPGDIGGYFIFMQVAVSGLLLGIGDDVADKRVADMRCYHC